MLFVFFLSDEPVQAIKKIPDGGARIPSGGDFAPEQRNVDKQVRELWEKGRVTRGGKDPTLYNPTSGRQLIYDVYAGTTNQVKKRGFHVTTSNNYMTFDGWSIIKGHHHHAEQNQATYIGLVNANDLGDRIIFKAAMRGNTSANGDVWDGQFGKCPPNAFNRPVIKGQSGACNMDYNYTQFRAYIDLREVFEGENEGKEWLMYIVKRVEDQILFDEINLPFETEVHEWRDGKVTMKSGQDARALRMIGTDVIKRTTISGGSESGNYRYFAPSRIYRSNSVDDGTSNQVNSFYRVNDNVTATIGGRTYRATKKNKWGASTFWDFTGDQARLRYEKTKKTCPDGTKVDIDEDCTVDVTIHHIDFDTGEKLHTDKKKATVGKNYSYEPEKKGKFKDENDYDYVAFPEGQKETGKVTNHNLTFTFTYRVVIPEPDEICEIEEDCPPPPLVDPDPVPEPEGDGSIDGETEGQAYWELQRTDVNNPSEVYAEINFTPTGTHYEIKNILHRLELTGYPLMEDEDPISVIVDAGIVKDGSMDYTFEYEFTNYYKHNYKCVDSDEDGNCFEWEYVDTTAVWDKGDTFNITDSLALDHRQHDVIEGSFVEDVLTEKLLVGRSDSHGGGESEKQAYYEQLKKHSDFMKSKNSLKTQTYLSIKPDDLKYSVNVPSEKHSLDDYQVFKKGWVNGHYFPQDVDDSLKEDLMNNTNHDLGDYEIFLQQNELNDRGLQKNKRVYDMRFVTDYFLVSENTGFIVTHPFAYQFNRHLLYGDTKPTHDLVASITGNLISQEYFRQTGEEFDEKVIGIKDDGTLEDSEKLQRYYLPVSPKSILEPNETHTNNILLENIGLNDVSWEYGQEFSYEHYLFGSAHDDAWIVEQAEGRIAEFEESDVHTFIIKDEDKEGMVELLKQRPTDRLHEFRVTDRGFRDKLKQLIGEY